MATKPCARCAAPVTLPAALICVFCEAPICGACGSEQDCGRHPEQLAELERLNAEHEAARRLLDDQPTPPLRRRPN